MYRAIRPLKTIYIILSISLRHILNASPSTIMYSLSHSLSLIGPIYLMIYPWAYRDYWPMLVYGLVSVSWFDWIIIDESRWVLVWAEVVIFKYFYQRCVWWICFWVVDVLSACVKVVKLYWWDILWLEAWRAYDGNNCFQFPFYYSNYYIYHIHTQNPTLFK